MIIGRERHELGWLGFDELSEQQDRIANSKTPDTDKIVLIRLQMLATAFDAMPPTFDIARAKRTAANNLSQLTTAQSVLRGSRIVKKLMESS